MNDLLNNADTLTLNSQYRYRLIRSKRRTLSLSVDRDTVVVRAPERAPLGWIQAFIEQKQSWIKRQISLEEDRLNNLVRLSDGARIHIAGVNIQLTIIHDDNAVNARARLAADTLTITLPACTIDSQQRLYDCFYRWIARQAHHYMTARTQQLADRHALQSRLTAVKFRRTKSKWGHCTSEGVIQYNPLIMLAPPEIIDYLIAHEVAHLKHANHSARFWQLVEKLHPNPQYAESWLKTEGYRLALDVE